MSFQLWNCECVWMIAIIQMRMTAIIRTNMGPPQTEKTRNHDRIGEVAARRIREAGTEAPGVAEIMAAAGLTHGGFYKQFGSRDELIAEAAERTYAEAERAVRDVIEGGQHPLEAFDD